MTKTCFVTTTIHIPHFLTAYSEDARRFGHECQLYRHRRPEKPCRDGRLLPDDS